MKRPSFFYIFLGLSGFVLTPQLVLADNTQLSPEHLDILDRRGYFTPAFRAAVHALVDAKKAVVDTKAEEAKLKFQIPAMQKQAAEAEGKAAGLRQQLSDLEHMDESDFAELQKKMSEAGATLEEQRILAQAYVWAYPTSPHQTEAQQDLQGLQKKIADNAQAAADAEAARVAAHAKLVQRAQAHDLDVSEWRDLLLTMSKEDMVKFMGAPQSATQDEWIYSGGWAHDVATPQKVGLDVNFNGGRVINVTAAQH